MIEIATQKALRYCKGLTFCYLCGMSLHGVPKEERDEDHVPPSGVFLPADRDTPLKLPTHRACNRARSLQDETVTQLIGLLHDKAPAQALLPAKVMYPEGDPFVPALGTPVEFRPMIWRWIRGFHAALYGSLLPYEAKHFIQLPLPSVKITDGRAGLEDRLPQTALLVDLLKKNRVVGRVDRLVCRNSKCRFESLWARADDGSWFCAFGLQVYDWKNLGDSRRFPERGCTGAYQPVGAPPENASIATMLHLPRQGGNPLDPFSG